jgi:hypothetical protein
MAQSLSKILLHIIFSTKSRSDLIYDELQEELYAYLATSIRAQGSNAYRIDIKIYLSLSGLKNITEFINPGLQPELVYDALSELI